MVRRFLPYALFVVFAAVSLACSPSLSPLYRDYEVVEQNPAENDSMQARVGAALREAGWEVAPSTSVPTAVTTEERTFTNWGLYRVVVSLEVVPVGDQHVRLLIHPYRVYFTGNRSKIPYLNNTLEREVVAQVTESLERQGFTTIDETERRERQALAY